MKPLQFVTLKDGKMRLTPIADQEQLFRQISRFHHLKLSLLRFGWLALQVRGLMSGKSTRSYKAHKGLKKQNLRDNMTNVELALNTLAEAATTELSKEINPTTYRENVTVAKKGGGVAKVAREQLEQQLGRSVIFESNSSTLRIPGDSPDEQ